MTEGQFLWLAAITIGQVVGIVVGISSLRRKPALSEELYRDFATKEELRQLRTEFLSTAGEIFHVTRQLKESSEQSMRELSSALHRVGGIIEEHCRREGK